MREAALEAAREAVALIRASMARRLVGKKSLVDGVLTAAMAGGHILLEGVPGLAKTLAVRLFAQAVGLSYRRIQFTPDLLPGDVTGTLFYEAATGRFVPREGPVFANIVLADEINRAPAKVQSALLEAMEERQVTMGERSLPLPEPFMVLATQNPVEHEGTFRLPEAQLDRFMLKLLLDYPDGDEELSIVLGNADRDQSGPEPQDGPAVADFAKLRAALPQVRFDEAVAAYAVAVVRATRPQNARDLPPAARELGRFIEYGASPRASIALYHAARAGAFLDGRDHVLPDDVKRQAPAVLRHRIVPSYEAEAERISPDTVIQGILAAVALP